MAGTLLADGRAEDVVDMVEPLLDPVRAPAASTGQILLRGLLARVEITHRDDVARGMDLLPPPEDVSELCTCVRAEVALWRGWGHARRHEGAGESARSIRLLKEAEELFGSINDPTGRCWALLGRAQAYFALDEYGLMRRMLRIAEPLVDKLGDLQARRWFNELSIPALRFDGRYDEAQDRVESLRSIADQWDHPRIRGYAAAHTAALRYDRGDAPASIIEAAEAATSILGQRPRGATYPVLAAVHAHVGALRRQCDPTEARAVIREAESALADDPVASAHLLTLRARISLRRGNFQEAKDLLDRLLDNSPHIPHGLQRSHIALLYGELLSDQGALDAAKTWIRRAYRNARETGHRGNQLRTLLALAHLHAHGDDVETAREHLEDATRYTRCLGALPHAYRWFATNARLAGARRRRNRARPLYTLARETAVAMGDRWKTALVDRLLDPDERDDPADVKRELSATELSTTTDVSRHPAGAPSVAELRLVDQSSPVLSKLELEDLAPLLARQQRVAVGRKRDVSAATARHAPSRLPHGFIAESEEMRAVADDIESICPSHSPVLLTGESGAGKGFVARAIHRMSERADGPVKRISCNPAQKGESVQEHLFGRYGAEGPAATGAVHGAEGGTLIIEDVAALPQSAQSSLLHLLDTGTAPVRTQTDTTPVDVRLIATTTADLDARVEEGRFLQRLRDRLRVISIHLPPLRKRRGDIPLLVRRFIQECRPASVDDPSLVSVTQPAMEALLRYNWPGNVRQLRNEIERCLHYVQSEPAPTIAVGTLLDEIVETAHRTRSPQMPGDESDAILQPDQTLSDVLSRTEKGIIERVLRACDGQITASADVLGLTRQGLYKKMKRLDIDASSFQPSAEPAPAS